MQVLFQTQTQKITSDGELRSAKKGVDGWYPAIPVFAFGMRSRNSFDYNVQAMVSALTQPGKFFPEALKDAVAYGEYGHPDMSSFTTTNQVLARLSLVHKRNASHAMRNGKIIGDKVGAKLYLLDMLPHGPYAQFFEKELTDPNLNATFSVRTILQRPAPGAPPFKQTTVSEVITFDSVNLNGFSVASKRGQMVDSFTMEGYSVNGSESKSIAVDVFEDDMKMLFEVSTVENVHAGILLDAMRASTVEVHSNFKLLGRLDADSRTLYTQAGRKSLMHAIYGGGC